MIPTIEPGVDGAATAAPESAVCCRKPWGRTLPTFAFVFHCKPVFRASVPNTGHVSFKSSIAAVKTELNC